MTIPGRSPERAFRALDLTVRRRLDGLLQGEVGGLRTGPGSEPDETVPYQPGDDVRRMDWNVTARTQTPHVRRPLAEHELSTWVFVDSSASMDFGTAELEKRDLATSAAATVGLLTDRPGNQLGVRVLHDGALYRLPPRPSRIAARGILRALPAVPRTAQSGDLPSALDRFVREHRRPGLRVVVSDLLPADGRSTGPFGWEPALRRLCLRNDVIVMEIVDPRELDLPDVGHLTLVDPETGTRREIRTSSRRLRARYAEAAASLRVATAAAVRTAGAAHVQLRTDRDWVSDLARHILARRRAASRRPTARSVR